MMSKVARSCGALVVLVMAMGPAHAQPAAQAERLFREGKELMAAGKIAEACDAFDASQRLDPTAQTLLNQANCRQQNRQLATAWALFLDAARQTRAATDRASTQMHATASDRATKLEPRLSTLRIDIAAAAEVAGLEVLRDGKVLDPATWNRSLPIDGGNYRISARAPGKTEWSGAVTVAAEHDAKTIEIPALRDVDLPPPPATAPTASPAAPRSSVGLTTRRKLASGVAAGSVLTLGTAAVLGVVARRRQDQAHALCPDPRLACDGADRANQLVRSGHNLAITANVAFGVAAAAAATAGILWVTGAPESSPSVAIVPLASGDILITASGGF
jgi:hypothetical protein